MILESYNTIMNSFVTHLNLTCLEGNKELVVEAILNNGQVNEDVLR